MNTQQPVAQPPGRRPRRGLFLAALLALLGVLGLARMGAAEQIDAKPTPPPGAERTPSPYAALVPSDEELAAMPPGIDRYLAAHTLPASAFQPANLVDSTKTASQDLVMPGGLFDYTITVRNTGEFDIPAEVTDTLPNQVNYIESECLAFITDQCEFSGGVMTWRGTVPEGGQATITISVQLKTNAAGGAMVVNTAHIESVEQNFDRSATITVDEAESSPLSLLPFTVYGLAPEPGPVTLSVSQPNSANAWVLTWTESVGAHGYEIQEAQEADFSDAVTVRVGPTTSQAVSKSPSPFNVYYYRVRSRVGDLAGPWSNVGQVIGGYRDDFDNPNTGWTMRRSTYLEEVKGFYENGRYVMQIIDRFDWGIVSPLQPAPRVPYAIDFEMRTISQIYAHSAGGVFGGDWTGQTCPPGTSFDEWYKHSACFNHFYNTNMIYNDSNPNRVVLQLLFERVDRLEWCQGCGGSPMKRVGDTSDLQNLKNINPFEWNHYRIEVRQDGIKLYAGLPGQPLTLQYEYDDTRWVNSPYFGLFASTDIIDNLTWRFEYVQVMPLD
ncbi:MAG: DUF11 domain-containing protein [Candidatus Promineofilum sp.]|nr:DUF11 domain-containing protein [Promineifilum sp.]MCW5861717.1 DUF11 domain-containing protein [Anaerolineae bacterium]